MFLIVPNNKSPVTAAAQTSLAHLGVGSWAGVPPMGIGARLSTRVTAGHVKWVPTAPHNPDSEPLPHGGRGGRERERERERERGG